MIPAVVLALVLVTPTFSLPISNQEFQISGTQTIQTATGNAKGEKTATDGDFTDVNHKIEKIQNQGYSGVDPTVQQVVPQEQFDTSVQYSEFQTIPQEEKTGVPVPQESTLTSHQFLANYPQNSPTSKDQNVFTSFEHTQPFQTESEVSLSVQPFTIIPDDQVREILQPVIVPSGAVEVEKLVIMAIEPVQQTNFQDVPTTPEKKVTNQQVFQPLTYSTTQNQEFQQTPAFSVQPAQKQDVQTASQTYISVQGQINQQSDVKEQVVSHQNAVQPPAETVQVYDSPKPTPQIYNVQPNAHSTVEEYVDHQQPQQSTRSTQQQSQFVQPTSQQQSCTVQQNLQKQGESQNVVGHNTATNQKVHPLYQQQEYPVVIESVQPYRPDQQKEGSFQKQTLGSIQQEEKIFGDQQPTKQQTPTQQSSDYVLDQNQPIVQQIRTVQSENHQNQSPVQSQTVQQQVYTAHPEYVQIHTPVQSQSVEPVQNTYQAVGVVEKREPVLQALQNDQFSQVYQEAPVQQSEELSNPRPLIPNEAKAQPSNPQVQTENVGYVPVQSHKNSAVQPNQQVFVVQPQQPVDYIDKPVYNFGDRVTQSTSAHQNPSVQVLSVVTQNQDQSGNPSVVSSQN